MEIYVIFHIFFFFWFLNTILSDVSQLQTQQMMTS